MAGQVGKLGNTAVRIEGPDGTEFYAVRIFGPDGRIAVGEFQSATDRVWTVNLGDTLQRTGGRLPTRQEAALMFEATRTGSYFIPQSSGREGRNAYLNQVANFQGNPNTEFGQSEKIMFLDSNVSQGYYGLYGARDSSLARIQGVYTGHGGSYTDYSHTGIIAIFEEETDLPSNVTSIVSPPRQFSELPSSNQSTINGLPRYNSGGNMPPVGGSAVDGSGGASPSIIDESEYYIINQRDKEMLDFIASKESNGRYTAVYPGERRNPQITSFSINQLLQFQQRMTQGFADPSADTEVDDAARSRPASDSEVDVEIDDAANQPSLTSDPAVDTELDDETRPQAADPALDVETDDDVRREFYSRTGAVGRYQFVSSQIIEAADFLELDRDLIKFAEPVQDAMCMEILKQKCDYESWLRGTIRVEEFQFNLSGQFESIPLPCGGSSIDSDSEVASTPGPDDGTRGDNSETPTAGPDDGSRGDDDTTDESEDPQIPEGSI